MSISRGAAVNAGDPRVRLVGRTEFLPPEEFTSDVSGGQALSEFAGRACYRSFDRPRPATADNAGYLAHILQVGHSSVLEHATATFYFTGISRSVVHEMLRHRHFSFSELSPRHVPEDGLPLVSPPAAAADPAVATRLRELAELIDGARRELTHLLREGGDGPERADSARDRTVRQASQRLLSGATATDLVMTGNYRAWRHFVGVRATDAADAEIRGLAVAVLDVLQAEAPHAFADFRISMLPDGTRMAASPLIGEG